MWDIFPPIPRFSRAFFMKRCETCEALSTPLEMTSSFSRLSQLTWHYTYWFACVGTSLNLHSVKDAFMNQQRLTQAWRVVWDEEAFNTVELMCYWQWSKLTTYTIWSWKGIWQSSAISPIFIMTHFHFFPVNCEHLLFLLPVRNLWKVLKDFCALLCSLFSKLIIYIMLFQ